MSGHSKWSTIKRAKAANDAKKGAIFTKISNLITLATREKGPDPETNFSLRMAMEKAKTVNMPKNNIDRAIKKATGELTEGQIEELYYEGIGPAQSQFIVKVLTDNKNRSASNIRHLFTKYGGGLSTVNWNFDNKGVIVAQLKEDVNQEELELELIDKGAQDIAIEDNKLFVYTNVEDLQEVNSYLEKQSFQIESAQLEYVPKDKQNVSQEDKEKIEKFIDELDENEDVSDYYTNVNI